MPVLIENCAVVLTEDGGVPARDGGPDALLVQDGVITAVGDVGEVPAGTRRLDAGGGVAVPGLVNTHHHMFQNLTRAHADGAGLFEWLGSLWSTWGRHDAHWQAAATSLASAELLLSGCTTTADHHYLPSSGDPDPSAAQAQAAAEIGIRLTQALGSMDVTDQQGGLAPAALCEDAASYLAFAERVIAQRHDPSPGSRLQVAVAPCHPLAVSDEYVKAALDVARRAGVRLHTHVAEARNEEEVTLAATGRRPVDLLEQWGLLGPDVWLAHAVHLSDGDVARLAATGTSVASCPSSNLRLGSGVARVRDLLDAGVTVSVGVDGSASNDGGNALQEARLLLLASRAGGVERGLSAREALAVATRGGALALGRPELGRLAVGARGDVAVFGVDELGSVGTEADLVAGLLLSPPSRARHVLVDGDVVVESGALTRVDEAEVVARARAVIASLRDRG